MKTSQSVPSNIDEYIADFPKDIQVVLEKVRLTIKKAAPEAEETISYKIPTFKLNGKYLIYFAGYKKHISLYPVPIGDDEFNKQIVGYQAGKGTLQFPLDKPIPYDLIRKIVKVSLKQNQARAAERAKK
jgi:uncharacterized protein YdhG (YjbR/CyaY superfamily)